MRIRYRIPFTQKLIVLDHWEIPLQGGVCRVIEDDGIAKSLEVVLSGQSVELAPRIEGEEQEGSIPTIVNDDRNLGFLRVQLEDAMAFLKSQFDIGLDWEEVDASYEPESAAERDQIHVFDFKVHRHVPATVLSFEILAGAIICAEKERGPSFEATLVATAREAMTQQRYIDSFRYSFLLIEALYGDGKFKTVELKKALKKDVGFTRAVEIGCQTARTFPKLTPSDTTKLLESGSVEQIIDHIVDKRGVYFHGNLKRQGAWRPQRQEDAHALAALCSAIVLQICHEAAKPMYAPAVAKRFREYAVRAGAQSMYQINFTFRMPEDGVPRNHRLRLGMNGTKPTGLVVVEVIKHFIAFFEKHAPMGSLEYAVCVIEGTGEEVFEMKFGLDGE